MHGVVLALGLLAGFGASASSAAEDLGNIYRATLEHQSKDPDAYGWVCTEDDVWRLSSFEFTFDKRLKVKLRASTLVIGQHRGNALWAVVLPDKPAKLASTLGGEGESIEHVWLRFHPSRIGELFPRRTVRGRGPEEARLTAYRIYAHKVRGLWGARYKDPEEEGKRRIRFSGYRPVVPPEGVVVLDMDTREGPRRVFSLETSKREALLRGAYLTRRLPELERVGPRDALAAYDDACAVADELIASGKAPQRVEWNAHEKQCRKGISRAKTGFDIAVAIHVLLRPFEVPSLRLRVGEEYVPAVRWDLRPTNASMGGIRQIMQSLERTEKSGIQYGSTRYGIGYVLLSDLSSPDLVDEFDAVLKDLGKTWGLIIDLRFGVDGTSERLAELGGRFVEEPVTYARHVRQGAEGEEERELLLEPRGPWPYRGPVYALIGQRTAGEAERLALMVATFPRGETVGERSMGIGIGAEWKELPGGIELYLRSGETFDKDGTLLPEDGLVPTKQIIVDPSEFTGKADPILWKVLEDIYQVPHEERKSAETGEQFPWPDAESGTVEASDSERSEG